MVIGTPFHGLEKERSSRKDSEVRPHRHQLEGDRAYVWWQLEKMLLGAPRGEIVGKDKDWIIEYGEWKSEESELGLLSVSPEEQREQWDQNLDSQKTTDYKALKPDI